MVAHDDPQGDVRVDPSQFDLTIHTVEANGIPTVRHAVTGWAGGLGLPADRVDDLAIVVTELVTNSVEHGAGTAVVRTWATGDDLHCEVFDRGSFLDRLTQRLPGYDEQQRGRGLRLVKALADGVCLQVDERGTTVRVRFSRR